MTSELLRLSEDRVPLSLMMPGPADDSEIVEFTGGTRLLFDVRDGSVTVQRLERMQPGAVYLERVRPCIGFCWYRLRFSVPGVHEILARVVLLAPGKAVARRSRRRAHRRPARGGV